MYIIFHCYFPQILRTIQISITPHDFATKTMIIILEIKFEESNSEILYTFDVCKYPNTQKEMLYFASYNLSSLPSLVS